MQTYAPLTSTTGLPDRRLERRLSILIDQLTAQPQATIPQATERRNDMDAAYHFFGNDRVNPAGILHCCLPETLGRLDGCPRILVLQDTSEANFSSLEQTDGLGYTNGSGVRGLLIHSALAARPDGLVIGLLSQQIWTRDPKDKGRKHTRRQREATDKESYRWIDHARAARAVVPAEATVIHVADREGDIYDWLAAPRPAHTHLLVRVGQADRIVVHGPDDRSGPLAEVVRGQAPWGRHELTVPRGDGGPERPAEVTVRVAAVRVPPPLHARGRSELPAVLVWVIEAWEEHPPAGVDGLCWRLMTTEPIVVLADALRAVAEYLVRWRIERFHYVLKQGCRVERLQLESADRLSNAVAVYSQVAVRVLRLTYLSRVAPETPAGQEFTAEEVEVLQAAGRRMGKQSSVRTVGEAVAVVARLGGHLGRKGDGPPGVKVLWRGLQRLYDQALGYQITRANTPERYP